MADETFLSRIITATKMPREDLRRFLGLSRAEMDRMEQADPRTLPTATQDFFWIEMMDLVNYKIGLLMAVRLELANKIDKDRERQAIRHAQMRNR